MHSAKGKAVFQVNHAPNPPFATRPAQPIAPTDQAAWTNPTLTITGAYPL